VGFELVELLHQLGIVHRGSEDQQRVVAVAHRAQGAGLGRARCAGLWVPGLPCHRSQAKAREEGETGRP
jgi:hypothetical protein